MSEAHSGATGLLGRFLELAIRTDDIAASVNFYERLGFQQCIAGDAWPHRYGVLSDGRIFLGLHECPMPSPALSFVLPQLQRREARLVAAQLRPEQALLGDEGLHQLRLREPGGLAIVLLEARTYSPPAAGSARDSRCGYFLHLSLPELDFRAARRFWERGGFIALPAETKPYAHVPLTSDHLDLAFHRPRTFELPLLVFSCPELAALRAQLDTLGITSSAHRPRGLKSAESALLEAPEGTLLLLLAASDG